MSHRKRGGGYRSSSQKNVTLSIIIVLFAVLLGGFLWMNKKDEDKKSAELQVLDAKRYQKEKEKEAALKQKKAEDSFYQKLSDGFDVNVLVVGDSIGAGAGTETDGQQWFKQLQAYLRTVNKASASVSV